MKTAINACYWNGYAKKTGGTFNWKNFVDDAAKAGFEGVEIGAHEDVKAVKRYVADKGLEIAAAPLNVTYNPFPPNTRKFKQSIREARALGVKTLMCCGGFYYGPRRTMVKSDYDLFASNLKVAVDYAGKHGLQVAYHPHVGAIVETLEEAQEVARRVPKLRFTVDIAHLAACYSDPVTFCKTFAKKIIHTHIKDYSFKKESFMELGKGDGSVNIKGCINALKKSGYKGWLCVECDKKAMSEKPMKPLAGAKLARRYLKNLGY